jgi:hypothetical protein
MEPDDPDPSRRNLSWGQRNALTILIVMLGLMFVLVIVVQTMTS